MPMGGVELLVVLAILLLFFGVKRVPQLARSLGTGARELKKAASEEVDESDTEPVVIYDEGRRRRQDEGDLGGCPVRAGWGPSGAGAPGPIVGPAFGCEVRTPLAQYADGTLCGMFAGRRAGWRCAHLSEYI
jgi:sec-independent protein translocase protein TatA